MDDPPTTQCENMAAVSSEAHPVYCQPKNGGSLYVSIASDSVCPDCGARLYLMEKRYAVALQVFKAGGRVRDLKPLALDQLRIWGKWRYDREQFRAVGVDGGEGGELGQGWQMKTIVVEGRDFYREAGMDAMSERYGPGAMLGWKENLGFDGFLGEMGPWEPKVYKGLSVNAVLFGVGGGGMSWEDCLKESEEGPKKGGPEEESKEEPKEEPEEEPKEEFEEELKEG